MRASEALVGVHPQGEQEQPCEQEPDATVETFGGKVGLRWDEVAIVDRDPKVRRPMTGFVSRGGRSAPRCTAPRCTLPIGGFHVIYANY